MVKKNVVATLTGTIFKKVTVEEGAKLIFTSGVVNAEAFDIKNGRSSAYTRLNFAGNTSVRVENEVQVGDWCRINEGGHKVTFYVEDNDFKVDGKGTRVVANVYAPNGDIDVHGDNTLTTYMTGQYIARYVKSSYKNVIWNAYDCTISNVIPSSLFIRIPTAEATESRLQVSTYPNPSDTWFNLTATSKSNEVLTITLYTTGGLQLQQLKALPRQAIRLGDNVVSGTYMVEVKQGNEKVIVKVVKL